MELGDFDRGKRVKISDVLEYAVDFLSEHRDDTRTIAGVERCQYSCDAIWTALNQLWGGQSQWCVKDLDAVICAGLRNMGLHENGLITDQFDQFERYGVATVESQLARALWLSWAALMARDQGV